MSCSCGIRLAGRALAKLIHPKTSDAVELEQLIISLLQQPSEDNRRKYGMVADKGHILREAFKLLSSC